MVGSGCQNLPECSGENGKQEIGNPFKEFTLKGWRKLEQRGSAAKRSFVLFSIFSSISSFLFILLFLNGRNNNMFRRNISLLLMGRI